MDADFQKNVCMDCIHSSFVYSGRNFRFIGCFCEPYKGKWVAELRECPLGKEVEYLKGGIRK